MEVIPAQSGAAFEQMITLANEYVVWIGGEIKARYPEADLELLTVEHKYNDLREKFPGTHINPDGCLRVAQQDGDAAGCVALGRLSSEIAELRTLYVRPAYRGLGVGKALVEAALAEAKALGYTKVRLDTLSFMESAHRLYRSFGFETIEPYIDMPQSTRQHILFFEKTLT